MDRRVNGHMVTLRHGQIGALDPRWEPHHNVETGETFYVNHEQRTMSHVPVLAEFAPTPLREDTNRAHSVEPVRAKLQSKNSGSSAHGVRVDFQDVVLEGENRTFLPVQNWFAIAVDFRSSIVHTLTLCSINKTNNLTLV